ncbi:MAG: hypothetical protein ACE5G0_01050 [Rhodothermales bacterium]
MDTSDAFGQGRFLSREELTRQNERLREELHQQREENALLAGLLAQRFEEMPEEDGEVRPSFPISDGAIDLFEALPEAFTLDEALDMAERIGQRSDEGTRHIRTYLNEEMVVQDAEQGRFVKTGRKPYF